MPKIVDHETKRRDIAIKASLIFLSHGYKSLGMRQLCEQLGMSKSAIYHYYPSKDALFIAATEAILEGDHQLLADRPRAAQASEAERLASFYLLFERLGPRYFKEMQLVADYIEVIGLDNVSSDAGMRLANQSYTALLADYISAQHGEALYSLLLGLLSQQMMQGKPLSKDYVQGLVQKLLR